MCAEHEATTKTQPRNGIRIRGPDDDLRFETIIASKSTTPAIQSHDQHAMRGSPCVDVSLHLYGHQYSPTDARSLRPDPATTAGFALHAVVVAVGRAGEFDKPSHEAAPALDGVYR